MVTAEVLDCEPPDESERSFQESAPEVIHGAAVVDVLGAAEESVGQISDQGFTEFWLSHQGLIRHIARSMSGLPNSDHDYVEDDLAQEAALEILEKLRAGKIDRLERDVGRGLAKRAMVASIRRDSKKLPRSSNDKLRSIEQKMSEGLSDDSIKSIGTGSRDRVEGERLFRAAKADVEVRRTRSLDHMLELGFTPKAIWVEDEIALVDRQPLVGLDDYKQFMDELLPRPKKKEPNRERDITILLEVFILGKSNATVANERGLNPTRVSQILSKKLNDLAAATESRGITRDELAAKFGIPINL